MNRLDQLSKISNAVLTPELSNYPLPKTFTIYRTAKSESRGELCEEDAEFRKLWCEKQFEIIGEFGAVLEV